jgi:hypothetical protein
LQQVQHVIDRLRAAIGVTGDPAEADKKADMAQMQQRASQKRDSQTNKRSLNSEGSGLSR